MDLDLVPTITPRTSVRSSLGSSFSPQTSNLASLALLRPIVAVNKSDQIILVLFSSPFVFVCA